MKKNKNPMRRNLYLFKVDGFLNGFLPLMVLIVVYFEQITGSYATAMGIFALTGIITSLSELPTGIISDYIGRRKSIILGVCITTACFFFWALAGEVGSSQMLVIGCILYGIGFSFLSGTETAMMYETMVDLRMRRNFDIVFSRNKLFKQLGLAISSIFGAGVIYVWSLQAAAWLSILPFMARIFIAFLYVDPKRRKQQHKNPYNHFKEAMGIFLKNRKLQYIAFVQLMDTSFSTVAHVFEGAYFESLIPMWMVNVARFFKQAAGVMGFYLFKFLRKVGNFRILYLCAAGDFFIRFTGLLLNNLISPFIMSSVNLFYGPKATAGNTLLQNEFTDEQRATMGSIISIFDGVVVAAIMYIVGLTADAWGVKTAIAITIFSKILIALWYRLLDKRYGTRK